MTTQTLALDDLIRLIDDLRLAGYDIGTQQYVNAQRLLFSLAAHGRHPPRPSDLRPLLAPVLCSSQREQENFYEYFPRWLARQPHLTPGDDMTGSRTKARRDGLTKPAHGSVWPWLRKHAPLSAVAVILLAALAIYLLPSKPRTINGVIISANEGNAPVLGASVTFAHQRPGGTVSNRATTDAQGKFTYTYSAQDAPVSLTVSRQGYTDETWALDASSSQELLTIALHKSSPTSEVIMPPDSRPDKNPSPVSSPNPIPTPLPNVNFEQLRLVALALFLLLFAAWWLWRLYRHRRMLLHKSRSARPPRLEHLTVKGAAEQLFQGQAFRRAVQELRRHRRRVSHDLDERFTIEATVRRGGLFTPFYGSRKTLPEYLALIERVSARDQQARFQEELVRRLIEENVIVDQYYFRGDPRICRRKDGGEARLAAYITLPDLAALHPDYYLLIFSDGAGFINPITGRPEIWLEQFTPWSGRALLTPESPAHWRAREWALQEFDFLILPAGRQGLEALGEAVNTGVPPKLSGRRGVRACPFPELLRERPRPWLEDHEPPPAMITRLLAQLTAYLGADGMNWLAACAVYPVLHGDLTLYLGFKLVADRDEFEQKLLALVSLPWLRYGTMPDWLRTRLISTLTPEAERTTRRVLEHLLITMLDPPPDGIRLDYSTPQKESTQRGLRGLWRTLRERLRTRKRRRTLRELFRTEDEGTPLQDFVFLTFMSGRRPRRLDVTVPDLLRQLLFPRGLRPLGLRPITALACATLLSFGGWMVLSMLEPDIEVPPLISFNGPPPVTAPATITTAETPTPIPANPTRAQSPIPSPSATGSVVINTGQVNTTSAPTESSDEAGVEKVKPAPGTGNVQGKVMYNGKPVPNIEVKLCEKFSQYIGGCSGKTYTAKSDSEGDFVITNAEPKVYEGLIVQVFDTDMYVFATTGIAGVSAAKYEVAPDKTLFVRPTHLFKADLKTLNPKAGAKVRGQNLQLKWEPYPDAAYYKISLYPEEMSVTSPYIGERVEGSSLILDKPMPKGTYRWKIEAFNGSDQKLSEGPDDFEFTVTDGAPR